MIDLPPVARIRKRSAWRLIPTRYPTVDLFRDLASLEDWPKLQALENETNERLRESAVPSGLVRSEDLSTESGSHYILAPLTHPNPDGSLFADGTYGVNYVALDFETALAEVKNQREIFLRRTREGPQRVDVRAIVMDLSGDLHDLRNAWSKFCPDLAAGRALAADLRMAGSYGLIFDSQVKRGGTCAAIFRPTVLTSPLQERHLALIWDGERITEVLEYSALRSTASDGTLRQASP